jgi:hypothetical protein
MNPLKNMSLFRKVIAAIVFLVPFNHLYSQPLFIENFNFSVRDSLDNTGGWSLSGSNTSKNVKVISPGLSYSGYQGSGIANTAFLSNQPEGDIVLHQFTPQLSGTVYLSFLFRVDSLSATATEGYNICLDEEGGSTNLNTKVYIKRITSSTFNFGIKKATGTTKYSPTVYSKNTTYLVVCSYTFVAGSNNDIARLYISSAGVPATQPVTPSAADTSDLDIDNIGELVLSNSFIQNGLQGSSVKIDGIRIGSTWNNTLFQPYVVQLNLKALLQGFYNSNLNRLTRDTVRVYLRYQEAPFTIADSSKAVLDTTGNGIFNFNRIGNATPYYFAVMHRNSIETWSNSAREFTNNFYNFDFTTFAASAYGNNQIQIGSKYCFYSGDVNQDGTIDATDASIIDNNAAIFLSGYFNSDLTGDNFTDATDLNIADNNSANFISKITP